MENALKDRAKNVGYSSFFRKRSSKMLRIFTTNFTPLLTRHSAAAKDELSRNFPPCRHLSLSFSLENQRKAAEFTQFSSVRTPENLLNPIFRDWPRSDEFSEEIASTTELFTPWRLSVGQPKYLLEAGWCTVSFPKGGMRVVRRRSRATLTSKAAIRLHVLSSLDLPGTNRHRTAKKTFRVQGGLWEQLSTLERRFHLDMFRLSAVRDPSGKLSSEPS